MNSIAHFAGGIGFACVLAVSAYVFVRMLRSNAPAIFSSLMGEGAFPAKRDNDDDD